MHNKKIRKFLKKPQANSGFTLIELLTGLIMSIFVTGALGFGLYQIMSATGAEKAKATARSEASRAIEFISDELRRAQSIQPDSPTFIASAGQTEILALTVPGLSDRIVYYLENSSGNWQGPQVLYRWGPPLDANGSYTTATWQKEALIDGIDDTTIANTNGLCDAGYNLPASNPNPSGFYACINGTSTAAQIFLTGGIDANIIAGNDSNYTAETKAVARAKNVTVSSAVASPVSPITFRSLDADYVCNTGANIADTSDDEIWKMRTDFDNSRYGSTTTPNETALSSTNRTATNMNKATKWVHEAGRQAQPININSTNDLTIYSIPVESTGCSNPTTKNNEGLPRTKNLSEFTTDTTARHAVTHTIKFKEIVNGRSNDTSYYKTFNGNTASGYNNPNVTTDGRVQVFKNGSKIKENAPISSSNTAPARMYPGYDPDGAGPAPYRASLGEFLQTKGYATYDASTKEYTIKDLDTDERIIAFEVGHTDNGNTVDDGNDGKAAPGFDLQDNIFIMTHKDFEKNHP
jgi:type II secretory pathway pseudopilin PulG